MKVVHTSVHDRVVQVLNAHRMKYGNVCSCGQSAQELKGHQLGTLGEHHREHVARALADAGLLRADQ